MNVVKHTTADSIEKSITTAFKEARLANKKVRIQTVLQNELTQLQEKLSEHKETVTRYQTWVDEEEEKMRLCQERIDNIMDLLQ
jgi:hypothetical protein